MDFLLARGAVPNGVGYAMPVTDNRVGFFAPSDYPRQEFPFTDATDLRSALKTREHYVTGFELSNLVAFENKMAVEVVLSRTKDVGLQHPVSVLFSEEKVYGVPYKRSPTSAGLELARLANDINHGLPVSYSGIFVEYSMPSKYDLTPSDSSFFANFFVASEFVGGEVVEGISDLAGGAVISSAGVTVLTSPELGGSGQPFSEVSKEMVKAVRRTVAQGGRH